MVTVDARNEQNRNYRGFLKKPVVLLAAGMTCLAGCANIHREQGIPEIAVGVSPSPTIAPPAEAWRIANAFAASREGAEVVLGLGDSMVPLYRNRTLLVIEKQRFETLEPGMTVVFIGDTGSRVAHALIRRVRGGWEARGAGNNYRDRELVTPANFIGRVTQAIELTWPRATPTIGGEELRAPTETRPTGNLIAATR